MIEPAEMSGLLRLKVWGEAACFTRPEMKVERVSYDVMTPSAARGVLESIFWKPAIQWHVEQIDVLNPIRWASVRRNEVGCVMSSRSRHIFVEEQRQQRAGLLLRDVAYTIHARLELTEKASTEDSAIKYKKMFLRRVKKGQCFHRPYLGCREFAAHFEPVLSVQQLPTPIRESRELGFMLLDMDYTQPSPVPRFFCAHLIEGQVKVPNPRLNRGSHDPSGAHELL